MKLLAAILLVISSSAFAKSSFNCEQYLSTWHDDQGRTIYWKGPKYDGCRNAEWAANVGKAARDAMTPEDIAKEKVDAEKRRKLAHDQEFMKKVNQIKADYFDASYVGVTKWLHASENEDLLKERNEKIDALAAEYGFRWDRDSGQFIDLSVK